MGSLLDNVGPRREKMQVSLACGWSLSLEKGWSLPMQKKPGLGGPLLVKMGRTSPDNKG